MNNNDYIANILQDNNISLWGFADLDKINSEQRNGLRYGICFGIALDIFPSVGDNPTQDYYDEYKRINKKLKEISLLVEEKIIKKGYKAHSLSRNRQNDDFRTILPFKTLATQCGLGWIGKSSTLITKEYGNAIRLNGVVTDMPLKTDKPISKSYCGNCNECVKHCPAQAISGTNWNIETDRNELINVLACKNKVIERGKGMGVTVGSCGICLSVCPWTQKYIKTLSISD